jgi:phage terminase small subunit
MTFTDRGLANTKQVQRRRKKQRTDEFGLTDGERKFADGLLMNPDQSMVSCYIAAGFQYKTKKLATKYASLAHRRPQVQAYLTLRRKKLAEWRDVKQARVVEELANIGFVDPADLVDDYGTLLNLNDMPERARKAISQIDVFTEYEGRGEERQVIGHTTKIRFVDKKGALDSLARILGFFKQDAIDTNGVAELMALIAEQRGGSTIGRLNSDATERPVLRPVVEDQQLILDSGQGGSRGPLSAQLGAVGAAGKLLVHERDIEGETIGDDDFHRHPPSG